MSWSGSARRDLGMQHFWAFFILGILSCRPYERNLPAEHGPVDRDVVKFNKVNEL